MFLPDTRFKVGDTIYTNNNGKVYRFDVCRITIIIDRDEINVLYHGGTEDMPSGFGIREDWCFDTEKEAIFCCDF